MSTAFFPTNMRHQSSGGYSNHSSLENIPYVSWKGDGLYRNPVGVTATHIRPLTNRDPGNVFPTGFGLARPIKHYRKGTLTVPHVSLPTQDPVVEQSLILYNVHRAVKSSTGSSLGGGSGGSGMIAQLMDRPGTTIVKNNGDPQSNMDNICTDCRGVSFVSDWMPNRDLTDTPQENVTNPPLCCNQQRKALQRVLPANTNLKASYFQTTGMYLYNRCQTFQQRQFNFERGPIDARAEQLFRTFPFVTAKLLEMSKPGDPLSLANLYVAQCNPNGLIDLSVERGFVIALSRLLLDAGMITSSIQEALTSAPDLQSFFSLLQSNLSDAQYQQVLTWMAQVAYSGAMAMPLTQGRGKGCARVYYKPNNPQFAQQGGVSSSTRILKLNVDTISTAAARNKRGGLKEKDKVQTGCSRQTYVGNPFFFQGQRQNKRMCRSQTNGAEYHTYNSVNSFSAGNAIGSTQSKGAGFGNIAGMSNATYFDNLSLAQP